MNQLEILERTVKKRLRVWLSCFILMAAAAVTALLLCFPLRYHPVTGQGGQHFLTLYYPGVSLQVSEGKVTADTLRAQLSVLHNEGYVTIGMEQIERFMAGEDVLPAKSLYLVFGDVSGQTALFANEVLRKYNFQAAFPAKGGELWKDLETITVSQKNKMLESGFWTQEHPPFKTGDGFNERGKPLTWLEPGEWSGAQLLCYMGETVDFSGEGAYEWNCTSGSVTSNGEVVQLCSAYGKSGKARLIPAEKYGDWNAKIEFPGQEDGIRRIYFRTDSTLENYLCLTYVGGVLSGSQKIEGTETVLFTKSVSMQPLSMTLNGSEWKIQQAGEIVAWVRVKSLQEGYTWIEVQPLTEDTVAEGGFILTLKRPSGVGERQIYNSTRLARAVWHEFLDGWGSIRDYLRVAL